MIKKGYTLAEVLITLAIIGVASALMLPAANSLKPDNTKMKFLRVYDSLSENIKDMANNSRIFPECTPVNNRVTCFRGYPFINTTPVQDLNNGTVLIAGGNGKLCRALAQLYTDPDNNNCSDNYVDFMNNRRFSFNTQTGESIYVTENKPASSVIIQVAFDVDGNGNGVDCYYNQNNCRKPDTFILWVTGNGNIYPGDRVTEYYLKTRKNVKSKNYDIRNHNNAPLRNAVDFTYDPAVVIENFN